MFRPPPFHPDRPTLVAPVRVDPSGLTGPTRGQSRSHRWRTTSHGFVVPSTAAADDPQQRIVEAAAVLRPGEVVTGWAALNWVGATWFSGVDWVGTTLPVPILTKREVTAQPGLRVSQEYLRPTDRVTSDGLRLSSPLRSLTFEMRHADALEPAVVALDMAAYADLVSRAEVGAYVAALMAPTGIEQARRATGLGDENSWSPQETVMRLVWTRRAGRPRPLCNTPIFDRWGRHVATPDLLDPEAGVVGEYEGALHLVGRQRAHDVRREGELRALGLEYVTMIGGDRADDYRAFLARLATAYSRARYAAVADRPWTITPPRWWIDTTTVEARRDLPARLRERLLRHRRAT